MSVCVTVIGMKIVYMGHDPADTTNVKSFLEWAVREKLLVLDPMGTIRASELYDMYSDWSDGSGMSKMAFGLKLSQLGAAKVNGFGNIRFRGGIRRFDGTGQVK